jgi:hypothetical protein
MPPTTPVLAVHGYEIYKNGQLGPLSKAVCEAAIRMAEINPDLTLILLGGWHLKEPGPDITISDAMERVINEAGIPTSRLITRRSMNLGHLMPPRDTHEEIVLLKTIFRAMDICGMEPFQFVAWGPYIRRIRMIQLINNIWEGEGIPVNPPPYRGQFRRRCMEFGGIIMQCIDPQGMGHVHRSTRKRRTLTHTGEPLIE